MKLFYLPGACSFVTHVLLEWVGEPYEAIKATRDELKKPEYLALNPQGAVPCIVEGDFVLSQNLAIVEYLNERYPQVGILGSQDLAEKSEARRWLAFCSTDLHKAFTPLFNPQKVVEDENMYSAVQAKALKNVEALLDIADAQLEGKQYLSGHKSAADVFLFTILLWCRTKKIDISHWKNLVNLLNTMASDIGIQKVMVAERIKPI